MAGAARRCLAEHAEPGGAELWAGVSLGGRGSAAAARWAGLAGQRTGLLCGEKRQSCRERKDQLLPFRQRGLIEARATRGAVARQSYSGRAAEIS